MRRRSQVIWITDVRKDRGGGCADGTAISRGTPAPAARRRARGRRWTGWFRVEALWRPSGSSIKAACDAACELVHQNAAHARAVLTSVRAGQRDHPLLIRNANLITPRGEALSSLDGLVETMLVFSKSHRVVRRSVRSRCFFYVALLDDLVDVRALAAFVGSQAVPTSSRCRRRTGPSLARLGMPCSNLMGLTTSRNARSTPIAPTYRANRGPPRQRLARGLRGPPGGEGPPL